MVKFFPRLPRTGEPVKLDKWAMSFSRAREARKASIENINISYMMYGVDGIVRQPDTAAIFRDSHGIDHFELSGFRRPYYSDSASCIISVQFRGEHSFRIPDFYITSIERTGGDGDLFDDFHIARIPNRFMHVPNSFDRRAVESALLRLYAEDDFDDELAKGITARCPVTWKSDDIAVGERYRFPSSLEDIRRRGRSRSMWDARGVEWELELHGGYQPHKFTYDNCPCLPIAELTHPNVSNDTITASDLREIIFRAPPLCDAAAMSNAMYILQIATRYITNIDDRKMLFRRILMLGQTLEEREFFNAGLSPDMLARSIAFCPLTWEKRFRNNAETPLFRVSFTSDMRQNYERIKKLVNSIGIDGAAEVPIHNIGFSFNR